MNDSEYIPIIREVLNSGEYSPANKEDLETAIHWTFSLPKCDTRLEYQCPICMRGKFEGQWYNLYCIAMVSGDPVFVLYSEHIKPSADKGSWSFSTYTHILVRCYYQDVMTYGMKKKRTEIPLVENQVDMKVLSRSVENDYF